MSETITKKPDLTDDDIYRAASAMQLYGGSFAYHIGAALAHADSGNRKRLLEAFGDLIRRYSEAKA